MTSVAPYLFFCESYNCNARSRLLRNSIEFLVGLADFEQMLVHGAGVAVGKNETCTFVLLGEIAPKIQYERYLRREEVNKAITAMKDEGLSLKRIGGAPAMSRCLINGRKVACR
ncbi:hypothetical protein [Sinorhizobium medicae]|uniref:hypothetical protein n=1 Tax=Sinorhizobium medicae TaxID=110321 RepID=UPI0018DED05F